MKNLLLILVVTPLLLAVTCGPEKDDFCDDSLVRVRSNNLANVENIQEIYALGDTLWFNVSVNNIVSVDEGADEVDISVYTNLKFHFNLNRDSAFESDPWLCVNEETVEIEQGELSFRCNEILFEKQDTQFVSRIGIRLLEAGAYNLAVKEISVFDEDCALGDVIISTTFTNGTEEVEFIVQ